MGLRRVKPKSEPTSSSHNNRTPPQTSDDLHFDVDVLLEVFNDFYPRRLCRQLAMPGGGIYRRFTSYTLSDNSWFCFPSGVPWGPPVVWCGLFAIIRWSKIFRCGCLIFGTDPTALLCIPIKASQTAIGEVPDRPQRATVKTQQELLAIIARVGPPLLTLLEQTTRPGPLPGLGIRLQIPTTNVLEFFLALFSFPPFSHFLRVLWRYYASFILTGSSLVLVPDSHRFSNISAEKFPQGPCDNRSPSTQPTRPPLGSCTECCPSLRPRRRPLRPSQVLQWGPELRRACVCGWRLVSPTVCCVTFRSAFHSGSFFSFPNFNTV